MGVRSVTLFFVIAAIGLLYHRQRHLHVKKINEPVKQIQISKSISERPFYTTGSYRDFQPPKIGILDFFSRKRINSFVINHYNHYRIQLTFLDLGYTSQFIFKISFQQAQMFVMHEKVGFTLSQNLLDGSMNYDFKKQRFTLSVRQYIDSKNDTTSTTFKLISHRSDSNLSANLTHVNNNQQCYTSLRTGEIVSHKCYGGTGSGKIKLERKLKRKDGKVTVNNIYNLNQDLTRSLFDGLRGSSMHWNWIWASGSGFSKPEYYQKGHFIEQNRFIGLNFGELNGQGEDMVFLSGKIIPVKGLSYHIDQSYEAETNITFTAESPRMQVNFTIVQVELTKKDLGLILVDMTIFHGIWAGWIEQDGKQLGFYEIAGIVEACDALF